jgi:hypothetical protein
VQYRLAADTPVTWVGNDRVRVGGVVRAVTVADTQLTHDLISELRNGAEREYLERIVSTHPDRKRADELLIDALLSVCSPVAEHIARRARVLVRTPASAASFARSIAAELARRGHHVVFAAAEARPPADTDLVVEVAERVLSPRRYLPLMADDFAHLVVARDDDGILLGPFVVPGRTPCLRCDDLRNAANDEMWIATATQLHDLPPAHPPLELEWLAAVAAAQSVGPFLAGVHPAPGEGLAFRRERLTGLRRDGAEVEFQSGCGCRAPVENALAAAPAHATGAVGLELA